MKSVEGLAEARACYCLAARKRARELTRLYEEKLRPHGLRATQFSILAALGLKGPTRVGDLADILGLERTTLTRSAAVLERDGRIAEAPTEDGRERRWQLTAGGRRALEAALPAWREAQREVERGPRQASPEPEPHTGIAGTRGPHGYGYGEASTSPGSSETKGDPR